MNLPIHVVGGGLIGLLTAYELAAAGEKVVVIDRQAMGREASWAGGGILSPLYPWRYPEPVNRLARWSQLRYPELIERLRGESGIDAEWIRSGLLIVDESDAELGENWCRTHSIAVEMLDKHAVQRLESAIKMRSNTALKLPDVAQIRNPRLLKATVAALRARGVQIIEKAQVTGFEIKDGALRSILSNGGVIATQRCVIAAGAWSGGLLAGTNLSVPIRPVKGQMLVLGGQEAAPFRHILLREACYLIPRRDGRILVGSTQEESGFDKTPTESAREMLFTKAVDLVPDLQGWRIEQHWAGLRPGSPDGIPYIGAHPEIKGLYINAGHFRNGIVLAPASARLAADLILGRTPLVDPDQFSPLRK